MLSVEGETVILVYINVILVYILVDFIREMGLFPYGNQVGEFYRDDLAVASAEDVALTVLEDVGEAVVVAGVQEEAACART